MDETYLVDIQLSMMQTAVATVCHIKFYNLFGIFFSFLFVTFSAHLTLILV